MNNLNFKFSTRTRNGINYVTVSCTDATYNELCRALLAKYPNARITSGGAYTKVTGVV